VRNKFLVNLFTIFFIGLILTTLPQKGQATSFREELAEAKRQSEIYYDVVNIASQEGLNLEDLRDTGYIYYSSSEDKFVILKKIKSKDLEKSKKMDKVIRKIQQKYGKKFKVVYVEYSYNELSEMQDNIAEELRNLGINGPYRLEINVDSGHLDLIVNSINEQDKNYLEKKYQDLLKISVSDQDLKIYPEKSRKADWNKLGAGLAIKMRKTDGFTYLCSTSGVAYKDSRYFLVTAGHCLGNIDSPVYQYNATLGQAHLDARASGYDLGLVNINMNTLQGGRYAYNGFWEDAEYLSDYDRNMRGTRVPYIGQKVCKTGITTDFTCGEVSQDKVIIDGEVLAQVVRLSPANYYLSASGDSGGAWVDSGYNFVGIHSGGNAAYKAPDGTNYSTVSYFVPWHLVASKYGLTFYTSSTPTLITY
jgi:hypothetical protein